MESWKSYGIVNSENGRFHDYTIREKMPKIESWFGDVLEQNGSMALEQNGSMSSNNLFN